MRRIVCLLLLLTIASPALSGAWLREKDAAFTAASATVFKEQHHGFDYKSSLYAEWGARDNLTVGFDFEENRDLYGHATVFARIPVLDLRHIGRLAAELGIGTLSARSILPLPPPHPASVSLSSYEARIFECQKEAVWHPGRVSRHHQNFGSIWAKTPSNGLQMWSRGSTTKRRPSACSKKCCWVVQDLGGPERMSI